jgi:hypothetical protein
MQFIRQIYEDLPDTIAIPINLRHIKAEVIILPLESKTLSPDLDIASFFGAIPDFPERTTQEDISPRAELT